MVKPDRYNIYIIYNNFYINVLIDFDEIYTNICIDKLLSIDVPFQFKKMSLLRPHLQLASLYTYNYSYRYKKWFEFWNVHSQKVINKRLKTNRMIRRWSV